MAASADVAVSDLSLYGLLARLEEVERLKGVKSPDNEQELLLQSEAAAKKAVAEELQAVATSGLTSFEKKPAKLFLESQLKAIDSNSKGAEQRTTKLKELLAGVEAAASKDEPAHVRKAKQDVAKAEKAFEEVSKNYERWEKGKKMLSVDEIKVLKRSYEDGQKKIEKARSLVEQQQCLRVRSAAAPLTEEKERGSAAMAVEARANRGRGSAGKGGGRGAAPAVSMRVAAAAGYPMPASAPQPAAGPSAAALRQAQLAAQVRAEAEAEATTAAPRPRPQPRPKQPEDGPVLSYACTVKAVSEVLGIKEAAARELAESSKEFAQHFDAATWETVQERSIAIEKANREKQREAEKRKQAAALAKATEKESAAVTGAGAVPKAAPKAAAPKAPPGAGASAPAPKPKPKAKTAAKKMPVSDGLQSLAGANRFGGFEDSDDDDGFTKVRR
mmetsp:Transcript_96845/g.172344  ORF Transcript_96845/g.172344 Transcript_96845/m.172344 type:complete len:445 (+) Transcript_96845:23-1357(+)